MSVSAPAPGDTPARGSYAADLDADAPALIARARDGDAEAFGLLYARYAAPVQRFIYFRVGDRALAEDLASETFLRALRRIDGFTWRGTDFGAWLMTIARNLVIDHFKSGRHRLEVCIADPLEPEPYGPLSEGPEDRVLDAFTRRTVLGELGRLGPAQRECIVLRFLHGLSLAETAAVMGRNEGAIKALQYRAVRALARRLPSDFGP
ncbi:MAG: sigma-70 family RNA polymerase sigma factor [Streptosporangiales bacterium]|nr:sigma-70 family RNA polymerase sigma factor [Streptosporangiales bacterium]